MKCGHNCKRKCNEDCNKIDELDKLNLYISPCKEIVTKELSCGHKVDIDCGLPIHEFEIFNQCKQKVPKKLPCGHTVDLECYLSS